MLDSEISKIVDAYTTVLKPRKPRKPVEATIIGLDSEFDGDGLICYSLAIKVDGRVISKVHYPGKPTLTSLEFATLISQFLRETGVEAQSKPVFLVSHFAQSELKHLEDLWSTLKIKVINRSMFGELGGIRIIDSLGFFPVALEKIGEWVGLEKISLEGLDGYPEEYWKSNMRLLHEKHPQIFEEYARRDSEILVEAFSRLRNNILKEWGLDILHSYTIAHLSGEIFTTRFLTEPVEPVTEEWQPYQVRNTRGEWVTRWRKTKVYGGSKDKRYFAMRTYWGGRREAFIRGLVKEPIEVYDVKSMYPTCARTPLPLKNTEWHHITGVENLNSILDGIGYVHCEFQFPPEVYAPCLPVYDSRFPKLLYPLEGESWCTTYELELASRLGVKIKSLEAWVFHPTSQEGNHPLKQFIEGWFNMKSKFKEGSLEYETSKLIMNSLIGKLAQRDDELTVEGYQTLLETLNYNFEEFQKVLSNIEQRRKIRNPIETGSLWSPEWASLITGLGRALISELMNVGEALTGHTDSIMVLKGSKIQCKALETLTTLGSTLEKKLEAEAIWIGRSALYGIIRNGKIVKVAHHGYPTNTHEEFARILEANLKEQAPAINECHKTHLVTPKEALKKGLKLGEPTLKNTKITWDWDYKRMLQNLQNPEVNIWITHSNTRAWLNIHEALKNLEAQKPINQKYKPPQRKLTEETLKEALHKIEGGESIRKVARELGVTHVALLKQLEKHL